ncbi:MAG: TIGR01777 family oxidoreductase [Luteibaculum sp.]
MMDVVLTGGTGTVGRALCNVLLEAGYRVCIVTRGKSLKVSEQLAYTNWDYRKKQIDTRYFPENDFAIIHLAGAPVLDSSWGKNYRQEIISSRVETLDFLTDRFKNRVSQIVSASGVNYYFGAEDKQRIFKEDDPANTDFFLGEVCVKWEEAAFKHQDNIPVSVLRTGTVLSNKGGAFAIFKKLARFGLLMPVGSGKQYVPWIHERDLAAMYLHALKNKLRGAYNAVADEQISHKNLLKKISSAVGTWTWPALTPDFAVKALLGQRAKLILNGAQFSNEKIKSSGFQFQYATAKEAVINLVERK